MPHNNHLFCEFRTLLSTCDIVFDALETLADISTLYGLRYYLSKGKPRGQLGKYTLRV